MFIFAQAQVLPRVFCQHDVLRNPRKIKYFVTAERDKGNQFDILD